MTKRLAHIIIISLLIVTGAFAGNSDDQAVLNLKCSKKIDIVQLEGKWEFYWMSLLSPEQLKHTDIKPILVNVPDSWTKYKIDSVYLPNEGFATYHLRIILPDKNKLYSIKLYDIFSAYNLWINDSLYVQQGKVATAPKNYKPKKQTLIITFLPPSDTIDLVLQVANFSHRKAGIMKAPYFGNPAKITNNSTMKIAFDFFMFGGLFIFAIFHFWLFFYRKKIYATLFFAISSLAAAFYTFFDEELIISEIFPNLNWELIFKGDYITNYFRVLFLGLFIYSIVHQYLSKFLRIYAIFIMSLIAIATALVIVTPVTIYSFTLPFFLGLTALVYSFALIGFTKKVFAEKQDISLVPLAGLVVLGLTMINDLLVELNIINGVELSNFGIFVFASTQSITLAQKHSNLYKTAEKLAHHFEKIDTIKRLLLQIPFKDYSALLKTIANYFEADNIYLYDVQQEQFVISAALIDNHYFDGEKDLGSSPVILKEFLDISLNIEEPLLVSDKNKLFKYLSSKINLKAKSVLISRLGSRNNPIGIIYLEKLNGYFTSEQARILKLSTTQITTVISNIKMFHNLEDINKNLENIVKQRTAKIEEQNQELELRTIDLDEKIEELRVTAEIINEMNNDLMEQKELIEKKNLMLKDQTEILSKQKALVDELNKQITDSVNYARRIQFALLLSETNRPSCDNFIIFKPKETVSGDFWWFKTMNDDNILIFGDTNLQGVAGAFMSILNFSILNDLITRLIIENITEITPDFLLAEFDKYLQKTDLIENNEIKLDAVIFNKNKKYIQVSRPANYIYLIDNNKTIIRPSTDKAFSQYNAGLIQEILLFTDGFTKEMVKSKHINDEKEISRVLESMKNLNFADQKIYFENLLISSSPQEDNILLIGIKIEI